jgi:hypothetical protein
MPLTRIYSTQKICWKKYINEVGIKKDALFRAKRSNSAFYQQFNMNIFSFVIRDMSPRFRFNHWYHLSELSINNIV